MDTIAEPFAMMLYRRFSGGETVEELAAAFGIPQDRVDRRIRAAALYTERQRTEAGLFVLRSKLADS
jgi:DNA-directed RNA polymerase specialized sigma24 family protein